MLQDQAWHISLVLIGLVMAGFLFVAVNSGRTADYKEVQPRAYGVRRILFWAALVLGLPASAVTLAYLPYPLAAAQAAGPVQVVNAVGHQWYWDMDTDTVEAGRPVEFRVSSGDVNHGFGIYDESMRIVAQTQAMPGYTNVLRHTFDTPGTYRVLCLEYCGLGHHDMPIDITVVAEKGA